MSSRCSGDVYPACICEGCGFGCKCVLVVVCSLLSSYLVRSDLSSAHVGECREVSKRLDAGQQEVRATSHGGEGWQAVDFLADRPLGNIEFERAVLSADDRVAFVAEFVKVPVVHPDVLSKFV